MYKLFRADFRSDLPWHFKYAKDYRAAIETNPRMNAYVQYISFGELQISNSAPDLLTTISIFNYSLIK